MNKEKLDTKINGSFVKIVLLPITIIGLVLITLFTLFRIYMFNEINKIEIEKAKSTLSLVLSNEMLDGCKIGEVEFYVNKVKKKFPFDAKLILLQNDEIDREFLNTYVVIQENIKNSNYSLVLYTTKEKILDTVESIKDISTKVIFIFLFIFLILIFFIYKLALKEFNKLAKDIVQPIKQLSNASQDITEVKNNINLNTGIEEIDELNHNFIEMVKELNIRANSLSESNKSLQVKVEDTTKELLNKNENINRLLDTTMEAVIIFDENYHIVQVNQSAIDVFEYDSAQDIKEAKLYDFVPNSERYKVVEALKHHSMTPYEINLYRKDKTIFPALVRGSDIFMNSEIYRISTIIDLSDVKDKDKQLLQQSKQAQMGEMIGMIAHQWRQPLNIISTTAINISLLSTMGKLDDAKVQDTTSFIQQQCQKMSKTIDTFMNFVKPAQEVKSFKLTYTIEAVMQIMGVQLANHNIEVNINSTDQNISVIGYEDLLEQVIINLLSNSRDAFDELKIPEKFINIYIDEVDDAPIIIIEDNAGGIDDEVVQKIFNPYFTTKKEGKGTGIGLYMSLDIMKKSFGGDLIYKHIENGSRFEIVFKKKELDD